MTSKMTVLKLQEETNPEPRGDHMDEALSNLRKLTSTLAILSAINPKSDFCITQHDLAEVFGALFQWSRDALQEVELHVEIEDG
jgi:hypothetical protein